MYMTGVSNKDPFVRYLALDSGTFHKILALFIDSTNLHIFCIDQNIVNTEHTSTILSANR